MKTKLAIIAAAVLVSSCAEYPFVGHIDYIDSATGAKGGLVFAPGAGPQGHIRIPLTDANGNRIGTVDLSSSK